MLHALNTAVSQLPWLLNACLGHLLPLLIALGCTWSLRATFRTAAAGQAALCMAAATYLLWFSAKVVEQKVTGGVLVSVTMAHEVPFFLAVIAATLIPTKLDRKAVFACTFWPLYVVDVLCCGKVFGGWADGLAAVGGAGPLDILIVAPVLSVWAVVCVERVRRHLGTAVS